MEVYCKKLRIEALTMSEMARREILPAISKYASSLVKTALEKKRLSEDLPAVYETETARRLSELSASLGEKILKLEDDLDTAAAISDIGEQAQFYKERILIDMAEARADADEAEGITAAEYWPFPTYTELLYSV